MPTSTAHETFLRIAPGAAYVNIFYLLLNDTKIGEKKDREICINIAAIAINVGITLSSLFVLLMDNTFLQ